MYKRQPLPTDQRGKARVVGARCDVGAYEYRPPLYLPVILETEFFLENSVSIFQQPGIYNALALLLSDLR